MKRGNNPENNSENKETGCENKPVFRIIPFVIGALAVVVLFVGALVIGKKLANSKNGNNPESVSGGEIASGGEITSEQTGKPTGTEKIITGNGINDTGDFTLYATEYEGRKGTGKFNYGEALQKSLLFYELQRSGDLPEKTRCNWRGDSALADGSDVGHDLTGGLYDAGDHVKFNLPMAYTAAVLSWSVYENRGAYEESGQLGYALSDIRWIDDYLIKCHTGKEEFYYQVGNGSIDHSWWGPCEVMTMERPAYKVDAENPGSTVVGEAAAALAAGAVIFETDDKEYSEKCLKEAKELYAFAARYQSDAGYTEANGFYNSYSGFYDELSFAATWLYLATGEDSYKKDAKKYFDQFKKDYKWTLSWDDASLGTALIMGRITKERGYLDYLENNLDYWTTGVNGERITYTPKGLAWLDSWGSLRYASTASFLAITYANSDVCPEKKKTVYHDFAVDQINYCLGSTGFSYQIGFGDFYPEHPHHRTSQGSPSNNMNDPSEARHVLCGALVGGPDANDGYDDVVSNYTTNEVADDYNAGFTGALAALYSEFGGKTLKNYGAVEKIPSDEIYVDGCINVDGDNFLEVKAVVYNHSAFPARALNNAMLCYFVDLSELYAAGGSVSEISVNMNYSQGGNAEGLKAWDEEKHIYYLPVSFAGSSIAPGTQDTSKKEVQFRMTSLGAWNNENDYSFGDIKGSSGNQLVRCTKMALYEGDQLVYGSVPDGEAIELPGKENPSGKDDTGKKETGKETDGKDSGKDGNKPANNTPAKGEDLVLTVQNQSQSGSASTLAFTVNLENKGKADLDLSDLEINYYFTDEEMGKLVFYCDYACIQGEHYRAVTDSVKGSFSGTSYGDATAKNKLSVTLKDKEVLEAGHSLNVQVRVARSDWSNMNFDDDYSAGGPSYMTVIKNKKVLVGVEPK